MERSRIVTSALLALSALTVVHSLHIVTVSFAMAGALLFTALMTHICAALSVRQRFVHAFSPLISFAFLIIILLIASSRGDFGHMIPSPANIADLIDHVRLGVRFIRDASSPFPASTNAALVYLVIAWTICEVGETLAQRIHSCAPTIIWYVLVNAVIAAQKGSSLLTVYIVLLSAASWFFLYAFNQGYEASKGHLIPMSRPVQTSTALRHLVFFTALAMISTILVMPISSLPSIAPKNVFKFLNVNQDKSELSPLVGMTQQLNDSKTEVLFTAQTTEAQYWRVAVLDDFDGTTWRVDSDTKQQPEQAPVGIETHQVRASVKLTKLEPKFLPSVYSTNDISSSDVDFLKGSVLYTTNKDVTRYTVIANVPPTSLTEAQVAKSSEPTPDTVENSLLLPQDFDKNIIAQARDLARNQASIYDQVMTLRNFFLDGSFTYDTSVDYSSDENAMRSFLSTKQGFCEQFATTYAAMARAVGIPARVVVGFTPGTADANGVFNITNKQAHSWVEVYLSNFGWLTVDPTPPGALPGQAPTNIGTPVSTTSTTSAQTTTPANSSSTPVTTAPSQKARKAGSSSDNLMLFGILIGILALAAGVFAYRRSRQNQSSVDAAYITSTWRSIGEKVLDFEPQPDLTIEEVNERIDDRNVKVKAFLDLLSDASYTPDAKISLSQLKRAAEKARNEKLVSGKK